MEIKPGKAPTTMKEESEIKAIFRLT